jgi:high affinity Mn2+ porin
VRPSRTLKTASALVCLLAAARAAGAGPAVSLSSAPAPDRFSVHYQATVIDQGNARFTSPDSGTNSLHSAPESATSVTSTLFLGARLRPGTELYANPELTAGSGISGSRGVAGFPNGETFRIGDTAPTVYAARLYVKQIFGLGGGTERLEEGVNQVAGAADARRLTFVAGKFGLADFFDGNAYARDPRSQFMNWTLMAAGAWDYPADTRGYTWGLATEYREPGWAVRGAVVAEPKEANGLDFDRRVGRANGSVIEGERALSLLDGRKGTARLLIYLNQARMGNYDRALGRPGAPEIIATRQYGRTKYGASFNADHELSETLGGFARASWSDGRNETWTFTEVDASQSFGVEWTPARWSRPRDRWGAAGAINELSGPHRRYLANGGRGFLLGDGALHYGPEMIAETYYRWEAREHLFVSPDYQFLIDPGYNRSRGPVSVWAVRVHAEF